MCVRRWLTIAGCGLAVLVLVVVGTGAWLKWSPRSVPSGQPALAHLGPDSLPAFRRAFNDGAGEIRILAMLSPT